MHYGLRENCELFIYFLFNVRNKDVVVVVVVVVEAQPRPQ